VDEAADVYSLGCILYECLARRQPFAHLAGGPEGNKSYNVLFKVSWRHAGLHRGRDKGWRAHVCVKARTGVLEAKCLG
jgi:hypothetical protein